ncbi:hypothetical protein GALL_330090 [mine drainage metagenome]|uniref:Uncharacterized protein n=1 Tax=mine drainage metagenome TaxID=410659 RepID=A0A1J5R604_9ZZZZ
MMRSVAVAIRRPRVVRAASASTFHLVHVDRRVITCPVVCSARWAMTPAGTCAAVTAPVREAARTAAVSSSGVLPVRAVARARQVTSRSRSGCTCLSGRVARVTCWRSRVTSMRFGPRPWVA